MPLATRQYWLWALLIGMLASMIVASGIGAVQISFSEWFSILLNQGAASSQKEAVLMSIRLPRVLMAFAVGAALAISGTALQGIFRNPLADPTIVGISSGAAASASLVIVVLSSISSQWYGWMSLSLLSVMTFLGAGATALVVYRIANTKRGTDVATMLLAGIAINALGAALTGLMFYLADDNQLRTLTFWSLGSLGGSNWLNVTLMIGLLAVGVVGLLRLNKSLNALALGESEAEHLGIGVERLKRLVILYTSMIVGSSVAFCGMIGFVGLAVPHILRLTLGADHRMLMPASALGGALLLVWADTLARTMVEPSELPIGIITAVCGAPVFLYLLFKQKQKNLI